MQQRLQDKLSWAVGVTRRIAVMGNLILIKGKFRKNPKCL